MVRLAEGVGRLQFRRSNWRPPEPPPRGWARIVADQVLQADEGCDLATLR